MAPEKIDSLVDDVKPLVLGLLRQISGLTADDLGMTHMFFPTPHGTVNLIMLDAVVEALAETLIRGDEDELSWPVNEDGAYHFGPDGSDLGRHGFFTFDNTADWRDRRAPQQGQSQTQEGEMKMLHVYFLYGQGDAATSPGILQMRDQANAIGVDTNLFYWWQWPSVIVDIAKKVQADAKAMFMAVGYSMGANALTWAT